jgi:formate-dependent nitrite reductase membrane component NrfD
MNDLDESLNSDCKGARMRRRLRERIAQGLIALALVLFGVDLAWVLPRLARSVMKAAAAAPEASVLAAGLLALVAARIVRSSFRRP